MLEQPERRYFEIWFSHIHSQLKKMRTAMICPESQKSTKMKKKTFSCYDGENKIWFESISHFCQKYPTQSLKQSRVIWNQSKMEHV